jgi:hypothetical protein
MRSACKDITSNRRTAFTRTASLPTQRHCGRSTSMPDLLKDLVDAQILRICVGFANAFSPRGCVSFALKSTDYTSSSSMDESQCRAMSILRKCYGSNIRDLLFEKVLNSICKLRRPGVMNFDLSRCGA